jgi:hypothetical protein
LKKFGVTNGALGRPVEAQLLWLEGDFGEKRPPAPSHEGAADALDEREQREDVGLKGSREVLEACSGDGFHRCSLRKRSNARERWCESTSSASQEESFGCRKQT